MYVKKLMISILCLLAAFLPSISLAEPAGDYYQQRAQELRDLKWGMFI